MPHTVMYKRSIPVDMPKEYQKGLNELMAEIYVSEGNYFLAHKEYGRAATLAAHHNDNTEWKRLNALSAKYFGMVDDLEGE